MTDEIKPQEGTITLWKGETPVGQVGIKNMSEHKDRMKAAKTVGVEWDYYTMHRVEAIWIKNSPQFRPFENRDGILIPIK